MWQLVEATAFKAYKIGHLVGPEKSQSVFPSTKTPTKKSPLRILKLKIGVALCDQGSNLR